MSKWRYVLVALPVTVGCFNPTAGSDHDGGTSSGVDVTDGSDDVLTTGDGATDSTSTGSATEDTGSDDTGDGATTDVDPPAVINVSPATGAMGVWADDIIVVTFSEPMNRVSTQAAFQSADIAGVVMMWGANDTELTIVPNNPLQYATGSDPNTLLALEYGFTIDTTATDLAGNTLTEPFVSSFFTCGSWSCKSHRSMQ